MNFKDNYGYQRLYDRIIIAILDTLIFKYNKCYIVNGGYLNINSNNSILKRVLIVLLIIVIIIIIVLIVLFIVNKYNNNNLK